MGGQVLDDADVADARREGALAAGEDLVDLAELTGVEALAKRPQGRVAALHVADGAHQPALGEGGGHAAAGDGVVGDGLLHHGVHAGLGQGQGDVLVVDGGDGHHGGIEPGVDEGVDVGQDRQVPGHAEAVAARIGHGHQLHALGGADDPGVVASHGAQADEPHAQGAVGRALVGQVMGLGKAGGCGQAVEGNVLTHVRHPP